ncbi:hypothetical protein FisN_7Lh048 [Fistulifera solaris]|uniref:Uncharacterized protein n=1 Tax=Fistulifera solaris TaxID=1519565 RepID=A0A1Z5JCE9_FISSO|nr:hypothetical protein FisN_7Lh048 [Fistulifera solaris]|eukprot:GAX11680.1 hypothetical protein FisN_7Lh048 [Fistulifera solaris]
MTRPVAPMSASSAAPNASMAPTESEQSDDNHMIEVLRQQRDNLSKVANLLQRNSAPSPAIAPSIMKLENATPLPNDPRAVQQWAPISGMDTKHPQTMEYSQYPQHYAWPNAPIADKRFMASSRLQYNEPVHSIGVPLVCGSPHFNGSFRGIGMPRDQDSETIISSLDFSERSYADASSATSSFASKTEQNKYNNKSKVSQRHVDKNAKPKGAPHQRQSQQGSMVRQGSAKLDSSEYNTLLAGRRKNKSSLNESKVAEYEALKAHTNLSYKKVAKPKNAVFTVSQTIKAVSTRIAKNGLAPEGDRTLEGTTPSGYTAKTTDSSSESSNRSDPTKQNSTLASTRKPRNKEFKMVPFCLSSVSLEDFHNHSTATNNPARALMIEQQQKPSAVKKEKPERPRKKENEFIKMLSADEFRREPVLQPDPRLPRSFDERLLSSKDDGRIL